MDCGVKNSQKAPKSKEKKNSLDFAVYEKIWFSLCLQYHLVYYETAAFPVEKAHTVLYIGATQISKCFDTNNNTYIA